MPSSKIVLPQLAVTYKIEAARPNKLFNSVDYEVL